LINIPFFFLTACGDSLLLELNPNQVVSGDTAKNIDIASGLLLTAQQKLHDIEEHQYQYQSNLHIDNYAGYLCLPQNFDGRQVSTYAFNKDFASGPRGSFFNVSKNTLPVMNGAIKLGFPELDAMAEILYCYAAQELVDVYGAFPWWDYRQGNQDPPLTYYSIKDVYDSIHVYLRRSVSEIESYSSTTPEHQDSVATILKKDRICGGDLARWKQFANSLQLRIAMHMSVVDPSKAKSWAKEAITSGVLEYNEQAKDIAYDVTAQDGNKNGNPLAFISNSWKDTRLNASFENMLKRLHSPMLSIWFAKNSGDIKGKEGTLAAGSEYVGMRCGIATTPRNNDNQYVNFSNISTAYNFHPVYLMKTAEVQFLLAEAAVRWPDGDIVNDPAQIYYDNGVYCAMADEGITDAAVKDSYYEQKKADTTIDYTDYFDKQNNCKGLITIGVAWDDDDSREVKLEKIITQKYIANFPLGLESWTDLRRTGFPRIFPVLDDDGDGSISEKNGVIGLIRRIPFIIGDDSDKQDVINSGLKALGGSDLQGTRLWWDVADDTSVTGNLLFNDN
jgi:hypothetical protein